MRHQYLNDKLIKSYQTTLGYLMKTLKTLRTMKSLTRFMLWFTTSFLVLQKKFQEFVIALQVRLKKINVHTIHRQIKQTTFKLYPTTWRNQWRKEVRMARSDHQLQLEALQQELFCVLVGLGTKGLSRGFRWNSKRRSLLNRLRNVDVRSGTRIKDLSFAALSLLDIVNDAMRAAATKEHAQGLYFDKIAELKTLRHTKNKTFSHKQAARFARIDILQRIHLQLVNLTTLYARYDQKSKDFAAIPCIKDADFRFTFPRHLKHEFENIRQGILANVHIMLFNKPSRKQKQTYQEVDERLIALRKFELQLNLSTEPDEKEFLAWQKQVEGFKNQVLKLYQLTDPIARAQQGVKEKSKKGVAALGNDAYAAYLGHRLIWRDYQRLAGIANELASQAQRCRQQRETPVVLQPVQQVAQLTKLSRAFIKTRRKLKPESISNKRIGGYRVWPALVLLGAAAVFAASIYALPMVSITPLFLKLAQLLTACLLTSSVFVSGYAIHQDRKVRQLLAEDDLTRLRHDLDVLAGERDANNSSQLRQSAPASNANQLENGPAARLGR